MRNLKVLNHIILEIYVCSGNVSIVSKLKQIGRTINISSASNIYQRSYKYSYTVVYTCILITSGQFLINDRDEIW